MAAAKTGNKRRGLAKVFTETNNINNVWMFVVQFLQFDKRVIGTSIVDKYDLITLAKLVEFG